MSSAAKHDWSKFTEHPGTYETGSAAQDLLPILVRVVIPYIFGAIALGIGVLVVGGNSEWLWAFVVPAVIGGWWLIWPKMP